MVKKAHQVEIISNFEKDDLLRIFLKMYNTEFWVHKARVMQMIIEDEKILETITKDEIMKRYTPEEIKRSFQYELYMTSFHSSETLFGVLFAFLFQKDTPWLFLSEYKTKNLFDLIEVVADKGIGAILPKDKKHEAITWLFFPAMFKRSKDAKMGDIDIDKNIKFIEEYLKLLARDFLDREDYNSYKHGFRGIPLTSVVTITDQETGKQIRCPSETCLYLDYEWIDKYKKKSMCLAQSQHSSGLRTS
jgi:hypothetical protein